MRWALAAVGGWRAFDVETVAEERATTVLKAPGLLLLDCVNRRSTIVLA